MTQDKDLSGVQRSKRTRIFHFLCVESPKFGARGGCTGEKGRSKDWSLGRQKRMPFQWVRFLNCRRLLFRILARDDPLINAGNNAAFSVVTIHIETPNHGK